MENNNNYYQWQPPQKPQKPFNGKKLGGKQVEKIGMLIEGSYWYNESDNVGNFTNYFTQTKTEERKISWMSLPTSLDVSVTEKNQGRKPTMVETASAFIADTGYTFPVYYDSDMHAASVYGISAIPTTFFIDANGVRLDMSNMARANKRFVRKHK